VKSKRSLSSRALIILGGGITVAAATTAALQSSRAAAPTAAARPLQTTGFAFSIPWDDATGSITSAAALNPAPLLPQHRLIARDGHFFDASGRRVKFIGVSIGAADAFPSKENAERVAAHLHKLGINLVRLHHMDARWSTPNLFSAKSEYKKTTGADGKTKLDPEAVARFDYFVAQLKKNGVYIDLNLHVSREWLPSDGFPKGNLPELGKVVAYFDARAIKLQKEFATLMLSHKNPYTNLPLATDPVLALIEINNEDSLLGSAGQAAGLPKEMTAQLVKGWNLYLKNRYAATSTLKAAWSGGGAKLGEEKLRAADAWTAETHDNSKMRLTVESAAGQTNAPVGNVMRATEIKPDGTNWHLQIHQTGLNLEAGKTYTVSFVAKAAKARTMAVNTRLDQAPWTMIGLDQSVALDAKWKRYSFTFIANGNVVANHCRLSLMVGDSDGDIYLGEASLRPGGGSFALPSGQSIERGNIELPTISASPAGRDYVTYLMQVEDSFTQSLRATIRASGATAAVTCSQASYGGIGGVYRESRLDWVDMHSYWQHPSFPGRPFDENDYRTENTPLVKDKGAGTLDGLAMHRVAGKPFTVSEYDHPAPNEWAAEMIPTIFAYAASQDWDGVILFAYGTNPTNKIQGFFDTTGHTAKLGFLPFAASVFLRGDLAPNPNQISLNIPISKVSALKAAGSDYAFWSIPETRFVQGKAENAPEKADSLAFLTHRASIKFERDPGPVAFGITQPTTAITQNGFVWNHDQNRIEVNSPSSKALIGFGSGSVEGFSAQWKKSARDFSVATISSKDNAPIKNSKSLLLTIIDRAENPGINWNPERTFGKNAWASGPVQAIVPEGVISIITEATSATVWALDPTGKRIKKINATLENKTLKITVGPQDQTIWYEIVAG
jgi:hypothetical protein